ncbi:multidrug efflux pump subunit AcrA (membrane-fusion protein) [Bradyrhizobium sp. LM6.11]
MHPSQNSAQNTVRTGRFRRLLGGVAIVGALAVAGSIATGHYFRSAQATATAAAAEQAVSVTVAMIEPRQTVLWDDFSGRLEAINRVELRPRVAGAIMSTNFTEGTLVKAGDILFKIDPGALRSRGRQGQRAARGGESPRRVHPE